MARKHDARKRQKLQPNGEDIFEGDYIMAERVNDQGRTEYLLKYKAYPASEAQWLISYDIGDYFLDRWRKEKKLDSQLDDDLDEQDDEVVGAEGEGYEETANAQDAAADEDEDVVASDEDVEMTNDGPAAEDVERDQADGNDRDGSDDEVIDVEADGDQATTDGADEDVDGQLGESINAPTGIDMNDQADNESMPTPKDSSLEQSTPDAEMQDDDFIPLDLGGMSPDYVNEPGPMPSLSEALQHELEMHSGGPIDETQEAVGARIKGIDGWLPERLPEYEKARREQDLV